MDSVLTYLVESDKDVCSELVKSIKKRIKVDNLYLINEIYRSFEIFLEFSNFPINSEIILSSLTPSLFYNIVTQHGFNPIVVDVNIDTGVPDSETVLEAITENTKLYINFMEFSNGTETDDIVNKIEVLNIYYSGFLFNKDKEIQFYKNSIISLNIGTFASSISGAVLLSPLMDNKLVLQYLDNYKEFRLSHFNTSLLISQFNDIDDFVEKIVQIRDIYRDSVLKSGYSTFITSENICSGYFPVVLKKSRKEIEKYCNHNGIPVEPAYINSIVKTNSKVKNSNAKYLSVRTLLFPLTLTLKKSSVELISKILSTLP